MNTESAVPVSFLFNLVVLPASDPESPTPLWQLSATRTDRELRLVSPHWPEPALKAAMAALGVSTLQFHNLLRGNRMANGGRDPRRLFFTEEQLLAAGLTPYTPPEPAAKQSSRASRS